MSVTNSQICSESAPRLFSRCIWRHPNSMPQYHVGHEALIKRIDASLSQFPTLALAGSAYHGVSAFPIASAPAKRRLDLVVKHLSDT